MPFADADGIKVINRSTLDSLAELLRQRERATIGGLELGEMLGRGSFGRVYKGTSGAFLHYSRTPVWRGRAVCRRRASRLIPAAGPQQREGWCVVHGGRSTCNRLHTRPLPNHCHVTEALSSM